ncbi:hypothetical protein CHH26_11615 [Qipengyuania flava]|uniref:hypothetical protein n=1 Tax=Qipengyuania flava TaxID=192812 RepID=UPI000B8BEA5D|nr:hypothetical protein [Qipengyuania flava]ASP30804.1 hypothetical protein CHH26_11615 [Qipengyuania flava]
MKLDPANIEIVEIDGELALVLRLGRRPDEPFAAMEAVRRKYSLGPPKDDFVAAFLSAMTIMRPGMRCRAVDLFEAYHAWCDRAGVDGLTKRGFSAAMKARGFRKLHSNGLWWLDVDLQAPRQGSML